MEYMVFNVTTEYPQSIAYSLRYVCRRFLFRPHPALIWLLIKASWSSQTSVPQSLNHQSRLNQSTFSASSKFLSCHFTNHAARINKIKPISSVEITLKITTVKCRNVLSSPSKFNLFYAYLTI